MNICSTIVPESDDEFAIIPLPVSVWVRTCCCSCWMECPPLDILSFRMTNPTLGSGCLAGKDGFFQRKENLSCLWRPHLLPHSVRIHQEGRKILRMIKLGFCSRECYTLNFSSAEVFVPCSRPQSMRRMFPTRRSSGCTLRSPRGCTGMWGCSQSRDSLEIPPGEDLGSPGPAVVPESFAPAHPSFTQLPSPDHPTAPICKKKNCRNKPQTKFGAWICSSSAWECFSVRGLPSKAQMAHFTLLSEALRAGCSGTEMIPQELLAWGIFLHNPKPDHWKQM